MYQLQALREKCNEPSSIPAFNSNWAKDHIFIHSPKTSPTSEASSEAALSTLAEELINRKITHVIPTTIATARFFLQNPGIFDQLSNCGSIYPSRYIAALASQTKVLCHALDTIWNSMSTDPLVPNLSHVVHQTKGNKRARKSQTLDSWNSLILQDGGADWIEEGMVIYALTLEGQVCPVSLYELEAVKTGSTFKLQLHNREGTKAGNVFSRVTNRNGSLSTVKPPTEMEPDGSWLVFCLADGYTATGTTYTVDCYRAPRHTANNPVLRVVRSDGKVMSNSAWIALGSRKKISAANHFWHARKLKSDCSTAMQTMLGLNNPTPAGIYRIIFLEIETEDYSPNRYLPISFTPWPLCTPGQEYTSENLIPEVGSISRLAKAMASALRKGISFDAWED